MATQVRRPADEHAWHACDTPPPPEHVGTRWDCPRCHQVWVWRRPPRPTAQWLRATQEDH